MDTSLDTSVVLSRPLPLGPFPGEIAVSETTTVGAVREDRGPGRESVTRTVLVSDEVNSTLVKDINRGMDRPFKRPNY